MKIKMINWCWGREIEEVQSRNNMLKILNPYLKRVMRGRQGLVDFWNKTLKFDSLEIPHSQMKADILPLLFIPLAWLGADVQAVSCAGFETWQRSYRAVAVPVLATLQGQLILP